ncbi:PREDICTED: ladinin-1, partial [Elephantulus edwardii]|uniref:ladinin-1 n=1 Tax=Elephantulus edwardii TaxID=28737 RepID=UPI0003F07D8C
CSLAKQRSLEDEEERERERRRRHRNLSTTTDDEAPRPTQNGGRTPSERLPSVEEAEAPARPPQATKDEDEDFQAILRSRRERRQRREVVEVVQAPIQERLKEEGDGDHSGSGQEPLVPKKELEAPLRRKLSRGQRGPWVKEEESSVGREPEEGKKEVLEKKTPVSEKTSVSEKTLAFEKRSVSEKTTSEKKTPSPEKTLSPEKTSVSEKIAASGKKLVLEKTSVSEKKVTPEKSAGSERRLVSEKASIFEKATSPETKPTTFKRTVVSKQPQAPEQLSSEGPQPTREQRGALPEKSFPPSVEPREQEESNSPTSASRFQPITLQVKIPNREEEEADITSPTQITYSSSLRRSSSRTISFRMSPRKDNSESTLTRSASVRLPASTVKLGEKLERYHTAIQRSESVKSPGSSRTEFLVAPVGVASKRHLFEKGLPSQSQAEPAFSRKENLRLSGVVTSRLNLWISRTQESGEQDPQEMQKESAATKRTQWRKKSDSPLDAEV